MSWSWTYERSDGTHTQPVSVTPPSGGFPSQADAETWIGEVWRELRADGVDAVTLLEDRRRVYGPMSLHPPQ